MATDLPRIDGYLERNSDNLIMYRGARDQLETDPDDFIVNAAMRVWLYTRAGVEVPGETWPLDGAYMAGSNGDYAAVIQDGIDWDADRIMRLVIEIDGGINLKRTITEYREVR